MGDLSNGSECDAFIMAFTDDIIRKYRSEFLDRKFEDQVRYYVMADDNWEVHLYAAIKTGVCACEDEHELEAHFRVESAPTFCPTSDDSVRVTAEEFDIEEDEVERRLEKGAEDAERHEHYRRHPHEFLKEGDRVKARVRVTESGDSIGDPALPFFAKEGSPKTNPGYVHAELGEEGVVVHVEPNCWPTVRFDRTKTSTTVTDLEVEKI